MTIDQNIFRDALSKAFIELLDSKRGVATELGKAVGKQSSFMSQVKRGKPVNSMHLKAVGIVFGPQKVIELLGLDDKVGDKNFHGGDKISKETKKIISKHQGLVTRFKNPEKGYRINERLVVIENISDELFNRVDIYIQGIHDAAQALEDAKGIQGILPSEEYMKSGKPNLQRGQGEEEERMDGTNGK